MSKNSSVCPKCGIKLKPTYMKQNCPNCGINLLYYKIDENLQKDAEKAAKEVASVKHFLSVLKNSSIASPLHILRLILFFTPLASMCLPMYWAGHKNVSLITFIMSIINHGFDFGAMLQDKSYLFAVISIVCVIVFSLAVIINSLFSCTKRGYRRNVIFSLVNTVVYAAASILVCANGGYVKAGFYVTMLIYALEFVLHYLTAKPKTKKRVISMAISVVLCVLFAVSTVIIPNPDIVVGGVERGNGEVSVVSFNLACAYGTTLEDTDSDSRIPRFVNYIGSVNPDFIGTQEMNTYWMDSLDAYLTLYDSYGVKRGGDSDENSSEMNSIFWLADKYTAVERNTFWLSETPNEESKYTYVDENGDTQEAGCNRICTYAVLENNETGDLYIQMNTHTDNSSEQARIFGVNVILDKINQLKSRYGEDVNVILTGDFNETSDGEAYQEVASVLNDCTDVSKEQATYQEWGYRQTGDKPIDFIFTNGSGSNYQVLNNISGGYVSDHYGVYSEINF
jgi:endonuclease/exonuclease/phosphatase family metal-dependent hydrolase